MTFYVFIGLGLFVFGFCYSHIFISYHQPNPFLSSKISQKTELQGLVIKDPIQKEKSTEVVVKTNFGKILLFTNSYPVVSYGEKINFKGKIKKPESFVTDSGRIFNYPNFLSKDGIFFIESYPSITPLSINQGNFAKEKLFALKETITNGMKKIISYPQSALLEGITISGKNALPIEINEQFKKAGISHVVVLSGYNVTIVALIIVGLVSKLPRYLSFGLATIGIASFCIMAGGTSTILRASIMSFLFLLAKFTKREANANRLLFIAGGIMIFFNPLIIFYDPSFQLSFLATFALINISPFFFKKLTFIPGSFLFREIIATSTSVQLFLLPFLAYSMGTISLVSLISNILILSFIPITMLGGFISSILSFFNLYLAYAPGLFTHLLLTYELRVAKFMSSLSFAQLKTTLPLLMPAAFYLTALVLFIIRQISLERQANLDFQKKLQHTSLSPMGGSPTYMNVPTYLIPK